MTTSEPDRDRRLNLAIRSLKLLGMVSALWGFVFVFAWGYFNKYERYRLPFIMLGMIAWGVPGVLFYLCGWMIDHHRRRRAAVWAMMVTLGQCLVAGAALAASLLMPPVSPIPIVLSVLWVAALVQLFGHLKRSLPLLQIDTERKHGFDVLTTSELRRSEGDPIPVLPEIAPATSDPCDSNPSR